MQTVNLGEDTRDGDDLRWVPVSGRTEEQVVTVTVQTADGISVPSQYSVTDRNNGRESPRR
ncbi:hypothetical protein [Salinibaculum salinum]|uniref:hypothetical protein n=1 Tax=Salinibaculum salinum TaxID=3131996 RepID=UPI0030EC0702